MMQISNRKIPPDIHQKVFRCRCGGWRISGDPCPACEALQARYRIPWIRG